MVGPWNTGRQEVETVRRFGHGMGLTTEPLRGQRLYQRVQQYIKQYIVANGLKPGDPLPPEGELASSLRVSRGSIREAIKALEALGFIEVRHGNGLFVRPFNLDAVLNNLSYSLDFEPSTISELFQIRKWLETAVMGDVIARIDDGTIAKLRRVLEEWKTALPTGDWARHDRQFHRVLNSVVKNRMLTLFLDIFWEAYNNATDETIKAIPDAQTTWADHERIVAALQARDLQAARSALLASYVSIRERIKQATGADSGRIAKEGDLPGAGPA
jgi:DNA-binding FadR family transcriptional regulator